MSGASQRYEWRLAALMGERKIRTGAELQRLLARRGYNITASQLSRIIYDRPLQIKTALLDALGDLFDCSIDELMPRVKTHRAHQGAHAHQAEASSNVRPLFRPSA